MRRDQNASAGAWKHASGLCFAGGDDCVCLLHVGGGTKRCAAWCVSLLASLPSTFWEPALLVALGAVGVCGGVCSGPEDISGVAVWYRHPSGENRILARVPDCQVVTKFINGV